MKKENFLKAKSIEQDFTTFINSDFSIFQLSHVSCYIRLNNLMSIQKAKGGKKKSVFVN